MEKQSDLSNVEGDRNEMPHEDATVIDSNTEFDCHMDVVTCNIVQVETYTPLLLSQICSPSIAPVILNTIGSFHVCHAVIADLLDCGVEEIEYRMSNLSISCRTGTYHDTCRATSGPIEALMSMYFTLVQKLQASVRQLGRFRLDRPGEKKELQQLTEYFKEKIRALNTFLNASRQGVASSVTSKLQYVPAGVTSQNYLTTARDRSDIVKSQCEPQSYGFQALHNFGNKTIRKSHVFRRSTLSMNRLRISPYHYRPTVKKQTHQRIPVLDILPKHGLMPHANNSCWLNAILGALYYALGTPLFLLQTRNLHGLSQLTIDILKILIQSRSVRVDETYVDRLLRLVTSQFNWVHGDKQDAGEFIMRILKSDLQQALALIQASSKYKVKAQCENCKQEETLEWDLVTVLDLECSKDLHVHIDRFLEQQFSQLKCNRCQGDFNIFTERNLSIISYPDLLAIHLSRGRNNFKSTSPIKIEYSLQLPQRQYLYSLKAVVVHRGNKSESGHFVTYFILPDRSVYLYDDCVDGYERVPFHRFEQEAERNAIVLFYK